ncbi:MAG: tyrosine-type recombinase/integrase [Anaerolineales bacterium]|nr:tyrosine-type recombinase/integrase [Anaerolineales bacterium]
MDYCTSINFIYTRDLSITFCARNTDMPVDAILRTRRCDLLADRSAILLQDTLLDPAPALIMDYLQLRDRYFPEAENLFPTLDGNPYKPKKYYYRIRKLLVDAGIKILPGPPRRLSEEQYNALLYRRFAVQRQRYQMVLAMALCSHLGLRPSEVAKLEKRDIDFGAGLLRLRDTKSQEDQIAPMLTFLVSPLECYTAHLKDAYSPLFVNTQGMQWRRRDVTKAIAHQGVENGLRNLTSRKLRASLGAMLSLMNVPLAVISVIMRHKDPATTARYYNTVSLDEARRCLEQIRVGADMLKLRQEYDEAYLRMLAIESLDK